jgi:predicted Zn-dependent protease
LIGAGLLSYMDSEDELAAVLGHEIEHVDHYHCAERVQRELAMRKLPLGNLIDIPIEVFEAGYSKDQEMEADREGTRLAVESGYSSGGALRMFETFQRLYEQTQARAKTPEGELNQVALETLEGYFRSHPLASERIEQIKTLTASEHWPIRSERDLAVAYFFWADKARAALGEHRYAEAQQLAMHALKMNADQPGAIETLARAQFLQADFTAAAESYRKLVERKSTVQRADAFALALAAADKSSAYDRFESWAQSSKQRTAGVETPAAGLALLLGRNERAALLAQRAQQRNEPEDMARLAWWYYLAGNAGRASELLGDAIQRRPGIADWGVENAWAQIDVNRLSDALQSLESAQAPAERQDRAMARAVAFWQAKEPDQALEQFDSALATQPEWSNPVWVKTMYSPIAAQAIEQMKVEQQRRRKSQVSTAR